MAPLKLLPSAVLAVSTFFALSPELRAADTPAHVPIKNANFQQGTYGWELINFGKGGTMAIDRTELHDGKPTLRIESFGQLTFVRQTVKVKPHTTYLLSGYLKAKDVHEDGGSETAGAVFLEGESYYASQGVHGSSDWQKATTQLNTEDRTEIRIGPAMGCYACKVFGTGWFSEVSLTELEKDGPRGHEGREANLITNANYEKGDYGWELINFGKDGQNMEPDRAELHDGTPTLRVESFEGMAFARQVLTVKPHTTYRLSGYIKVKDVRENGGSGKAGACLIVGSTQISTRAINGTADWQEVSIEFNSQDKVAIRVGPSVGYYAHKVSGTGWFSGMSLTEVGGNQAAR